MPEWSHGFVEANGLKLHYTRTGGQKPAVILNHGAGEDGLAWTHVARALEGEYDVILPDARGHGRSGSGKGDYSTAARAADLAALVSALRLDRPVIGGHSLGADTAFNFAVQHPDQLRALILEDPPIYLPGEVLMRAGKPVDQAALGKKMVAAMRLFKILPTWLTIPMLKKAQPTYPEDEIIPMALGQKRVSFDFIRQLIAVARAATDPVELFAQVRVPVLLFTGDRDNMSIVSPEAARQARQLNPLVEVVHLPGASHNIRRDRFDGCLPALQEFLHRVTAARKNQTGFSRVERTSGTRKSIGRRSYFSPSHEPPADPG